MKDRPILFSGSMVRAILEGRKTQTRRIVKGEIPAEAISAGVISSDTDSNGIWWWLDAVDLMDASPVGGEFRCPYGVPGDLLWVRENFRLPAQFDTNKPRHVKENVKWWLEADGPPQTAGAPYGKLRPAIHLPRVRNRLTLPILDVRIERLKDITEADALAEGIKHWGDGFHWEPNPGWPGEPKGHESMRFVGLTARQAYLGLWEHINGRESLDANPWVWVVCFDPIQKNVDAVIAAKEAA